MTYTFKLSRRLARLKLATAVATSLLILSCSTDDGLQGPGSPTDLANVLISPDSSQLGVDQTMQFQAILDATSSLVTSGKGKGQGRQRKTAVSLAVDPVTSNLAPTAAKSFRAVATLGDGSTAEPSVAWAATGGTVDTTGRYTAGKMTGTYHVIATTSTGLTDTAAVTIVTIAQLVLTPASASLLPGATLQFAAEGKTADAATISVVPRFTATGGTISAGGVYTAGQTAGDFRVIATDSATGKADTSAVTITPPSPPPPGPTLEAVVLTPTSVSLSPGATQQFSAAGRMSDGSPSAVTVAWSASGGTMSSTGLYTAGQTAGTYRVIATQSGGALADTAVVNIAAPPPTSGHTYFFADAEAGGITPWSIAYGDNGGDGGVLAANSTDRAHGGTHSWKHEVKAPSRDAANSKLFSFAPQTYMGSPVGSRYTAGYYSWWVYIDAGYTDTQWNLHMGWMSGVSGSPEPIANIGIVMRNGVLQAQFTQRNAGPGNLSGFVAPTIPNYDGGAASSGWYYMTPSSPAGIKPMPRGQWVHFSAYTNMQRSNGVFRLWQDGVLIFDMTHPNLNLYDDTRGSNPSGGMVVQLGIYGGAHSVTQRIYTDDFRVTDYRVVP